MSTSYQNINSSNKENLIKSCLGIVRKIAWHYHGRVKNIIEIDDLIQIGMLGLVTAAENFTERPGVAFASYAKIRIKGEIVDFLRKNSNLCRTTIKKKQEFDKGFHKLQSQLGREPSKKEVVDFLNVTEDEFNYWETAFQANKLQSIDAVYDEFSILFASKTLSPEDTLADKELKNILKIALKNLNQREALVTQLYYVEELNVYEIAEVLEISTGRVSQIKKSIITKLRGLVNAKIT